MSQNNPSSKKPEVQSCHANAEHKHSKANNTFISVVIAVVTAVVGATVLVYALSTGTVHAADASTTVDKVEQVVNDSAVNAVTVTQATDGKVCEASLPEDSPFLDRLKDTFDRIGCKIKVFTHSDGNTTAEVAAPDAPVTAPAAQ